MVFIRIVSAITSVNLFVSFGGLIYYGARTISYRSARRQFVEFLSYTLFYTVSLGANFGNWLILNFVPIWGDTALNLMADLYKITVVLGGGSCLILGLTLRYEIGQNQLLKTLWQGIMLYGATIIWFPLFQPLEILTFENQLPVFDYSKSAFAIFGMTFFELVVLFWYGANTFQSYLIQYRKQYGVQVFHFLFLTLSIGAFLVVIGVVGLTIILPMTNQLVAFTLTLLYSLILIHPTLRWTYLYVYRKRVLEFERNTLLDVINHDLTNIAHMLLLLTEMRKKDTLDKAELEMLVAQVERMSLLLEKARNSVHSGLMREI